MGPRLRVLGQGDLEAVMGLLTAHPVENLFVLARVASFGLARLALGCDVYGVERDGQLVSVLHAGSNLVPVAADEQAIKLYVRHLGPRRQANSIMGRSDQVRMLWEGLSRAHGQGWSRTRDVRPRQPLMTIDGPPRVEGDPRVRRITMADFEAYFDAAVAMYTEEVGVSPLDASGSYRYYVRTLILNGRAFGIVEDGKVVFKTDIGSVFGPYCQIQGVWLAPELRGQGASVPAMAQVVNLVAPEHPHQSLYVNDYNVRARRLYEACGFTTAGEFATVLY